jgi:DNA-binding transcriptional regulator YdaS (Cro superfamily)
MGLNTKILDRIAALGMTNDAAAHLSGVSPTRLSQFSRGVRELDNYAMQSLCQIITEAEMLTHDFPDFPFDWRQVARIRDLLDSRREAIRMPQR